MVGNGNFAIIALEVKIMSFDLPMCLETAPTIPTFELPLIIYGAGYTGRAVYRYLAARDVRVEAFLDANATDGQFCEGVPVFKLNRWKEKNRSGNYTVLVAIHNRDVAMVPIIETLEKAGFRKVMTMIDFTNAFPDKQPFRFWLVPRQYYHDKQSQIDALFSILEDNSSRNWAESILHFRIQGDYGALPQPSPRDQYFPSDLTRWAAPVRLVDCGAYDGDTIDSMIKSGYRIEAVASFEPDLVNFAKLAVRFPGMNSINFPCGVSSSSSLLRFSSGCGESSHIDAHGDSVIQCVKLDEAIPAFAPNLIKMDVEGAEIEALRGAKGIIEQNKPNLAISLYHFPSHIWEIPLLIHSWQLDYKFYIRGHEHNSFDSVLYALQ